MTTLACLPLDDRPVNYDYPRELAALAGLSIALPERAWLGNPWRTSRHAELVHWLQETASRADALLVALDTLGYGGLIPSRTSTETAVQVLERLSVLKKIKADNPHLVILAYSVILRISRADSAEEEKDYWAEYGSRMFRLSYLEHKASLAETTPAENSESVALHAQIPEYVYTDYLKGRTRNHTVNRAMLDWLEEGLFDYLLLPQDDTADYGWNIAEARTLQATIRQKGLTRRAITYPGADESASLLLARYACMLAGFNPKVLLRYSSAAGPLTVTAYEDRPIHELLKAHLAPLNGSLAGSSEQADLHLFLNAPAHRQGAAELQELIQRQFADPEYIIPVARDDVFRQTYREMTSPHRSVEEFLRAMKVALEQALPVALADVAYVNGADLILGRELMQASIAPHLLAYAGWNTAGNTLGTVLAHAILNLLALRKGPTHAQRVAHLAFLFRRYLDDYYYQAVERTRLLYDELPALGLPASMERLPESALPEVAARLQNRLFAAAGELRQQFVQAGLVKDISVRNICLPWQRLFEIGFDVNVEIP